MLRRNYGIDSIFKQKLFQYICSVKPKQKKSIVKSSTREQILRSAIASFKIEGIIISAEQGLEALKRVEKKDFVQ